ncbi:MAG: cyclic nucleotide-binding/CBS domain-containing protein [Gammaproteobacteria bacterium]|nr:cyclic nucleotide-binding/CBS domain-containing protein [Gammaproteobacteria bacterium]
MEIELQEISGFLQKIPPFDTLPSNKLAVLSKSIEIEYARKGTILRDAKEQLSDQERKLYLIKKGALAYYGKDNELLSKYSEGDLCSVWLMPDKNAFISVLAEEDTLLYRINKVELDDVIQEAPEARAFFGQTAAERLNKRLQKQQEEALLSSGLITSQVTDFYHSPAATIEANQSIQQTAITMTELGYSCLVVIEPQYNKERAPVIAGIVTDKDIRIRCVVENLDIQHPVSEIMTPALITIEQNESAYDALIKMTSHSIHHLPVTQNGQLSGMLTITDLMNHESENAVNIASLIRKSESIEQLKQLSKLIPKLQVRMAKLGASADQVGKSISAITVAITHRLINMAEQKYGPAPVPYAWLAAGSQARLEQLSHSDQDNALIIDNSMLPEHQSWFKQLAHFVCDGLAECGFIYCPGNIMATNQKWRQTKKLWQNYFQQWVESPTPDALLNSSVFFDLATVYGDHGLLNDVRADMLQRTQNNSLFIAHLSRNAQMLKPPLGFFRDFVLVENGNNEKALDLKHNGLALIVDLARIYALQQGVSAVNTQERLKAVAGSSAITKSSARNLIDSYTFLSNLRLKHQADQLSQGKSATNFMHPKALSKLEREHLKDVFKVIKTLQDARQVTY